MSEGWVMGESVQGISPVLRHVSDNVGIGQSGHMGGQQGWLGKFLPVVRGGADGRGDNHSGQVLAHEG